MIQQTKPGLNSHTQAGRRLVWIRFSAISHVHFFSMCIFSGRATACKQNFFFTDLKPNTWLSKARSWFPSSFGKCWLMLSLLHRLHAKEPGAFSQTVRVQKVNLALFPTGAARLQLYGSSSLLSTPTLWPLRGFARTDLRLLGSTRTKTHQRECPCASHAMCCGSWVSNTHSANVIHTGLAHQCFSRQDIVDPVCGHLSVVLFSVTSTSCHVPCGFPLASRSQPSTTPDGFKRTGQQLFPCRWL